MRRLRWIVPERSLPAHPYRDSAIVYALLAVLVVVLVAATGGSLVKGVAAGAAAFVLSTAYSWWRWRERQQARERRER